jgi:DNA-binding NarL/FixJ family response regulator
LVIRVIIAHPETLYKQALSTSLSMFNDIIVVEQARYYEELMNLIQDEMPNVVVADESVFGSPERFSKIAQKYPDIIFVSLTRDEEKALKPGKLNQKFFLTYGYLIDLYRLIKLSIEEKTFAQPAVIKKVLSKLRRLEDSGMNLESFILKLDKKKIGIVIDIILGKSFDEICFKHNLSPDELDKEIRKIISIINEAAAQLEA